MTFSFVMITKLNVMNIILNRDRWIRETCKNKKVLHVGPCDWPYTGEKLAAGKLLYQQIDQVCSDQLGIDLDKDSVDYLNGKNFKQSKIIHLDMSELNTIDYKPDVIIFGEAIEHMENPGVALDNLSAIMDSNTDLIITTPNATRIENFITAFLFKNNEHPDHKIAFTFSTLSHLLDHKKFNIKTSRLGFIPYYNYSKTKKQNVINIFFWIIRHFIAIPLSFIWKYFAETLVFVVNKK